MCWVHFAVDEPAPAHLHPVTVPAVILDYAVGLEQQGKLQAGEEADGSEHHGPGALGFAPTGPSVHKGPRKRVESMQRFTRKRGLLKSRGLRVDNSITSTIAVLWLSLGRRYLTDYSQSISHMPVQWARTKRS